MISALNILVVVVATTAEAGFVAPVASGYIYRNDNNGPASLIQLGALPYQQPHAFAPPLPLAQPIAQPIKLQALEAYDLAPAPAPLPYILPQPKIVEDHEDDDSDESDESSEEYLDGGESTELHGDLGVEKEAGSDYGEEHHNAHGEKESKGYRSEDKNENGASGHYGKQHHEGHYKDNEETAKSHHDEADAHGKHYESGKDYEGEDHGHKKHFSKGEDVTGYHKVFHKDEFKKDHDFYDVADNSGHFNKYENDHKTHSSDEGGQKEGGHHNSAYDAASSGKTGYHAKGQIDENSEGHSAEEGHDSHHEHEEDYGKKGGSTHEKEYGYDDEDGEE